MSELLQFKVEYNFLKSEQNLILIYDILYKKKVLRQLLLQSFFCIFEIILRPNEQCFFFRHLVEKKITSFQGPFCCIFK